MIKGNFIYKRIERLWRKGLKNAIKLNVSYLNFLCHLIKIFRTSEDATVKINEIFIKLVLLKMFNIVNHF
jgi:hypothetical protein